MKTSRLLSSRLLWALWLSTAFSFILIHTELEVTAQVAAEERIVGVAYGPFREGQSPDLGIFPTLAQMQADMPLLKRMGNVIRTYSVTNNFEQIIGLAKQAGLTAIPTAWIGSNDAANNAEIAKLIALTPQSDNLPFVIVGSEAILRGDKTPAQMIAYINQVKQTVSLPVTTSEPWHIWRDHPALGNAVGIICINVFPYWETQAQPIENAVSFVVARYKEIKGLFPGKRVIITETGWPSAGEIRGAAVPSVANQRRFWQEFLLRAEEEKIDFLAFAAFDEAWKGKPGREVEAHWGLYTAARQPKHDVISVNLTAATVSAASYLPGAAVARESIVSVFGNAFGPSPMVKVTSATQESTAFLFYPSPTQINYQIPPGIGTGIATVTVTGSDGSISMGLTKIADIAPGIFTATADGKGFAAAKVQRIREGRLVGYEEMVQTIQGQIVAIPIDLGPESDQVFLNLFGTGIRFRSSLSAVTAQIGSTNAEVTFADAQGQFIGLDQINVRIPRNLIGRGEVDVVITVDTQRANVGKVNIK